MLDSPTDSLSRLVLLSFPESKNQVRFNGDQTNQRPTLHWAVSRDDVMLSKSDTSGQVWVILMQIYLLFHQPKAIGMIVVSILTIFYDTVNSRLFWMDGRFMKLLGQILDLLRFYTVTSFHGRQSCWWVSVQSETWPLSRKIKYSMTPSPPAHLFKALRFWILQPRVMFV